MGNGEHGAPGQRCVGPAAQPSPTNLPHYNREITITLLVDKCILVYFEVNRIDMHTFIRHWQNNKMIPVLESYHRVETSAMAEHFILSTVRPTRKLTGY